MSEPVPSPCVTCRSGPVPSRHCAPARCYCGHDDCPAFASFIDPWSQPLSGGAA